MPQAERVSRRILPGGRVRRGRLPGIVRIYYLYQALRRVGGLDGEPVIQLKTAFGGGKTHSMLALYHLLRGRTALGKLPHIKALVDESGINSLPVCHVAVLVGTALEPA